MQETITISSLDAFSATVQRQKTAEIGGKQYAIGPKHSVSYVNSLSGRQEVQRREPETIAAAAMAMWGDTPTVEEPREEQL